jgi:hypothetical protein
MWSWALKVPLDGQSFLGTHTGNVLTDVDVPILIPIDAKYKKTETIGFTTRFRPKDKKALKSSEIAKMAGKKVKCLYVKLVNQMLTKKQLKMGNGFCRILLNFVINSDEVKETILDFILYKEIDILTMVSYKRTFFSRLIPS